MLENRIKQRRVGETDAKFTSSNRLSPIRKPMGLGFSPNNKLRGDKSLLAWHDFISQRQNRPVFRLWGPTACIGDYKSWQQTQNRKAASELSSIWDLGLKARQSVHILPLRG